MSNTRVLFLTNSDTWWASEELWSQAAIELSKQGFDVSASVGKSEPVHPRIRDLKNSGIYLHLSPARHSLWDRAWHYAFFKHQTKVARDFEKILDARQPGFVLFSNGNTYPEIELLELCISRNLPFATVSHKNWGALWLDDGMAERYHKALSAARRCYFVSKANLRLTEKQLGFDLSNAEVVRNPYNVDFDSSPAWPALGKDNELRLANVARLDPGHKGQDVLFEALASPAWTERAWHLTLYGDGPVRNPLKRHVNRLGLSDRVTFAGHVSSIEEIWTSNHVLVMPSHYEGLPLAMVEAMMCGRPVLATDVAGHSEIIIDGVTGFLAESPTAASLSRSLEILWASRENLKDMGEAGAKRIREIIPENPARVFSEKLKFLMSRSDALVEESTRRPVK